MCAQALDSHFIRDLCLALAHRVEPERLFMILTVYMDESGTHRDARWLSVASAMANVRQWGKFQRGLDKIKKQFGFAVLHMKDFKHSKGEFKGWSADKKQELIKAIVTLASDELMYSVDFIIRKDTYDEFCRDIPRKIKIDSRYGLGFRVCLSMQIDEITRRLSHHKKFSEVRLNVVMESGCANAGDVTRIFGEMKDKLGAASPMLSSLTFASKKEADPLMFADFLAHSAYMDESRSATGLPVFEKKPMSRERSKIVHTSFGNEGMKVLKKSLLDAYEAKRAWGARRWLSSAQ